MTMTRIASIQNPSGMNFGQTVSANRTIAASSAAVTVATRAARFLDFPRSQM